MVSTSKKGSTLRLPPAPLLPLLVLVLLLVAALLLLLLLLPLLLLQLLLLLQPVLVLRRSCADVAAVDAALTFAALGAAFCAAVFLSRPLLALSSTAAPALSTRCVDVGMNVSFNAFSL
jgi:hypothetical protein